MLTKAFFIILGTCHFLFLYTCMFFTGNVLVMLSLLFVKPLMPAIHERLLCLVGEMNLLSIVDWTEYVGGAKIIFTGEQVPGSAIIISNHVSFSDSILIHGLARRAGELGHIRVFAKQALAYQPVFGWMGYFLNYIFLSRHWDADKKRIHRQLKDLSDKAKMFSTKNFWIMIFPEGTRVRPKKLQEAQEYSKKKGIAVLKNLLVPRVKGFHSTLEGVKGTVDGVIDLTIGYKDWTKTGHARPSVGDCMFGGMRTWNVHIHVRFFPIADIPVEEEETSKWLMKVFEEKDQLLEDFKKNGSFPGKVQSFKHRPAYMMTLNHICLLLLSFVMAEVLYVIYQGMYIGATKGASGAPMAEALAMLQDKVVAHVYAGGLLQGVIKQLYVLQAMVNKMF